MLHGVMTSARLAAAVPRENPLQAEAAAVERLRRQIAELPAKGAVASPELLAEFARAQKKYLDKKIGFEMQRRKSAESGIKVPPAAEKAANQPVSGIQPAPAPETAPAPAVPVSTFKRPESTAPLPSPDPKPSSVAKIVIAAVIIAAVAAAAWYFLSRH